MVTTAGEIVGPGVGLGNDCACRAAAWVDMPNTHAGCGGGLDGGGVGPPLMCLNK